MIIRREQYTTVEFGELAPGDVFVETINGAELVQMKIAAIQEEDGTTWNTVTMEWGEPCYTEPNAKVCRVVAELHIK